MFMVAMDSNRRWLRQSKCEADCVVNV